MELKLNEPIKVIRHSGYGSFGSVTESMYKYAKDHYSPAIVDSIFKNTGIGNYMYIDYDNDDIRFNKTFIEIIENCGSSGHYVIDEIYLEVEVDEFDGYETSVRIIGR